MYLFGNSKVGKIILESLMAHSFFVSCLKTTLVLLTLVLPFGKLLLKSQSSW